MLCIRGSWLKLRLCWQVEESVLDTIRAGKMTKDLAICVHGTTKVSLQFTTTSADQYSAGMPHTPCNPNGECNAQTA